MTTQLQLINIIIIIKPVFQRHIPGPGVVERRHRYSGFIGKLEGNMTSGRFRRKLADNIRMDLIEIG